MQARCPSCLIILSRYYQTGSEEVAGPRVVIQPVSLHSLAVLLMVLRTSLCHFVHRAGFPIQSRVLLSALFDRQTQPSAIPHATTPTAPCLWMAHQQWCAAGGGMHIDLGWQCDCGQICSWQCLAVDADHVPLDTRSNHHGDLGMVPSAQ